MEYRIFIRAADVNWKEWDIAPLSLYPVLEQKREALSRRALITLNLHICLSASRLEHCVGLFYSSVSIIHAIRLLGQLNQSSLPTVVIKSQLNQGVIKTKCSVCRTL